ncbi:MAG: hypothetical protein LZF60_20031 [Nitrospira sp.]|nr:MAG: hypothetical protein LZF60_20031 [Nitrospira sp.]
MDVSVPGCGSGLFDHRRQSAYSVVKVVLSMCTHSRPACTASRLYGVLKGTAKTVSDCA